MMLSDKTLGCLYAAGWSENYAADISLYQQSAVENGYPLPAIVIDFLTKFGRLQITYPLDPRKIETMREFLKEKYPNPLDQRRPKLKEHDSFFLAGEWSGDGQLVSVFYEDLKFMAEKMEIDSVYAIGWLRDDGDLLMDLEGNVYLFFGSSKGGSVLFLGSSGEEAIEVLCSDEFGPVIKKW